MALASSVVAFDDIRVHVSVAASEHHPQPGGSVPLGQHPVVRRVVLGSNSIAFPIEIQMTNFVSHQKINAVSTQLHWETKSSTGPAIFVCTQAGMGRLI